MKIDVEIVTGFLGAGKTSFINSLLTQSQIEGEKVLIFQFEFGEKQIFRLDDMNYPVKLLEINEVKELKEKLIYFIKDYNPNRVIIEYNGTLDLNELFAILNEKINKKFIKIKTIFFVADGKTLSLYIDNMKNLLSPFIQSANMVIINDIDNCSKEDIKKGINKIKKLNSKAYILKVKNKYTLNSDLMESKVLDNGFIRKLKIRIKNSESKN